MSCLLSPAPASEMILRRCKFEHQWLYSSWVCLSSCPPGGPAAHSITPPVPCTLLAADLDIHHGGVLHLPLDVLVLPRGADRVPAAVARLRHRQPGTSTGSRDQLSANHSSPVQTGLGLLLLAELDLDADLLLVLLAALRPHHVVIVHTWTPAPIVTDRHEMSSYLHLPRNWSPPRYHSRRRRSQNSSLSSEPVLVPS